MKFKNIIEGKKSDIKAARKEAVQKRIKKDAESEIKEKFKKIFKENIKVSKSPILGDKDIYQIKIGANGEISYYDNETGNVEGVITLNLSKPTTLENIAKLFNSL